MTLTRRILLAFIIGVLLTLLLAWFADEANRYGYDDLSSALFWQNSALQAHIPMLNVGTADHPIHEATPLHVLAFLASFPIGFLVYGVGAFIVISNLVTRQDATRRTKK
jgi:4-amino-4-deoxy-L-arabinose transferase-like glycosyltransferase